MTVCSHHVTYAFQSESTLYISLNIKELLARNKHEIWSLSDSNGTRTHNHLVCKRTYNHLAKWLSVCLQTKWLWVQVLLQSLEKVNLRNFEFQFMLIQILILLLPKGSIYRSIQIGEWNQQIENTFWFEIYSYRINQLCINWFSYLYILPYLIIFKTRCSWSKKNKRRGPYFLRIFTEQ